MQDETVTPGPAVYFTVGHPFTGANPLKVGVPGLLTVTARDQYGNVWIIHRPWTVQGTNAGSTPQLV